MATITPTLTLVSNASSAITLPGPLSVALALTATTPLTVDTLLAAGTVIPTTGNTAPTLLFAGETLSFAGLGQGADGDASDTPGTHGSYLYIRNSTAAGTGLIYLGTTLQGATAPANTTQGTTALDHADDASLRLMTLKRGEFAFMPWDFLQDIYVSASAASQSLEYFLFDR